MAKFQSTGRSNKRCACKRLAVRLEKHLVALGFETYRNSSRVSASEYVMAFPAKSDGCDAVKIRVSDHDDRYGADFHAWVGQPIEPVVARVRAHFAL
jgi:hypothetical protein